VSWKLVFLSCNSIQPTKTFRDNPRVLGSEARSIIKEACGADEEKDVCLFVGSGSTAAILKLVDVLGVSTFQMFGRFPTVAN
jgi:hypothetical protein